jgi:hypothetical protein
MIRRSRAALSGALVLAVSLVTLIVLALPSQAELPGSNFESTDGNLTVEGTPPNGGIDWVNVPNRVRKDEASSGTSDDAFGQGAKEDLSCPTEVTGSIPPNKSNLTRFYVAHETGANGHFYVYLAWERTNVLGSANMDFEFNQSTTLCDNEPAASAVPIRTAGDILVTFDFTNGGGNPVLGLLTWVTTGSKSQCFAANAVPCWGNRVELSAAGFADGSVNLTDVTDPIANVPLPALTFGEAAIDLTAAGVFEEGDCSPFASVYLKSRSSASFPAELKDFVPPKNAQLNNCGSLKIVKTSVKGNAPLAGATFSITQNGSPVLGSPLTTGASGTICIDNVPSGTYSVTETGAPTGYQIDDAGPKSVTVTAGGAACPNTPAAATASFTDTPLSKIQVKFTSLAGAGVTNAQIVCTKGATTVAAVAENGDPDAASPNQAFDDTDETFTSLTPGVYTCTVDVDP